MEHRGKTTFDTNHIGSISESAITTRFLQLGYYVYFPYGGNERTDMLIENEEGEIWRVQCKTGWLKNGAVYFDTANHNVTGTKRKWRHYRGQCDYFAVFCRDSRQAYLIPVDQVGTTRARWAKDYEL
jgi:hypothetical protein